MADLDELAPNYRRAQQRWQAAPTLAKAYHALGVCFASNTYGLVEQSKSFIESVCLTIMGEFRAPMPSSQPSTTDLLVAALDSLGFKNTKGAVKLDKVLSGFNRLADAITDMRNDTGPVAHGKDGFLAAVSSDHARAFLHAGDAILGVLLNALEGKEPDLVSTREPYETFPHLHERIDRAVAVEAKVDEDADRPIVVVTVATGPRGEAFELRIEPSRLLYGVDREAYVDVLKSADLPVGEAEEQVEETESKAGTSEAAEPAAATIGSVEGPATELVTEYQGSLTKFREGVKSFLWAENIDPTLVGADGVRLVDSLLATADSNMALDWKHRETMQAKMRVASKRVLVRMGFDAGNAEEVAGRFVAWLRVQAVDSPAETAVPADTAQGEQA